MIEHVRFGDFQDRFRSHDRQDQFSVEGKKALFDYLEQYEEGTGEDIELDVIALCCEYTEYENLKELQDDYSNIKSMDDLEECTTVIKIDDERFIIQAY